MLRKSEYVEVAEKYVDDILSGKILACKWVRLACERQVRDLKNAPKNVFPYDFDVSAGGRADRVCKFIEYMPHIKGKWVGGRIVLEPWQKFLITTLFGWYRKSDGTRRFRESYIEVPRKNAKSTIAAAVGTYMTFFDGEAGAEGYSGATSERQALEVFRPAWLMTQKTPDLRKVDGLQLTGTLNNPTAIYSVASGSRFCPVVGNPGDGSSPHIGIVDEYHEHPDSKLHDSFVTGMGSRSQPMLFIITTAGVNLAGPCYEKRARVLKILDGLFKSDDVFGCIYTIDEDDDWREFDSWVKANPNYGVSIDEDFLKARREEALQQISRQNIIRCKHLNEWMNAGTAFFDSQAWQKCYDEGLSIEYFAGRECVAALDLASKKDLAALALVFPYPERGDGHYAVFAYHYLPEDRAIGETRIQYKAWADEGWITLTPGNVIDYEYIKQHLYALKSQCQLTEVSYDPFQATQLAIQLSQEGFPMVEYGMTVRNMSDPMKELDRLIVAEKIHHRGDPVLSWMLSNVVARWDLKDNVFPRKESAEQKIDGAVALIMGIARVDNMIIVPCSAYANLNEAEIFNRMTF